MTGAPFVADTPAKSPAWIPDGFWYGAGAYFLWGLMPIYFKLMDHVRLLEIVAHRVVWSLLLVFALLTLSGGLRRFIAVLRTPRAMLAMTGSAVMICVNWLVYIWAVNNGHIVAGSLGYFLNPLVNVLLGFLFLGERMRRNQLMAIGFAAIGVFILAVSVPGSLWISLVLAFSFAFYGLIRKMAPVGPLDGLAAETLILTPLALAYLFYMAAAGTMALGKNSYDTTMLVMVGAITTVPMLFFATAARRLQYSTLGLMQYIAPTIQLVIAIFIFHEPLSYAQMASFGFIWVGLALFTLDSLRVAHSRRQAESAPEAR